MMEPDLEYVGFWPRVGAALIDTLLLGAVIWPLLTAIYGLEYWREEAPLIQGPVDLLLSWILPSAAVIAFWIAKQATPGKMAISARIVDATTGNAPRNGQLVARYLGYFVASLPFFVGLIWVAFDRRKQGWHDKLAGTVVIRKRRPEPVKFEND